MKQEQTNYWAANVPAIQTNTHSQFHQRYEELSVPVNIDKQKIEEAFRASNIYYDPSSSYQNLSLDFQKVTSCFGFYRIHVKIAHFSLTINTLKVDVPNLFKNKQNVKGTFGKIYFIVFEKKELCFKSFSYESQDHFEKMLIMAIKEWVILKICSVLQCSPKMENYLGFDMIIYEDCILLVMQKGESVNEIDQFQGKLLKEQLRIMHEFKIIHFDIKPENIVFSRYYDKLVFIDFGFSQIIRQQCGFKTLTSFKGTPNYCSQQVMALMLQKEGYADLYYNDINGLELVIRSRKIKQIRLINLTESITQLDDQTYSTLLLYCFQFQYINSNLVRSQLLLTKCLQRNVKKVKQVLSFLKEVVSYIFLPQIFEYDLSAYKQQIQYKELEQERKCKGQIFFFKVNQNKGNIINFDQGIDKIMLQIPISNGPWQKFNYHNYLKLIMEIQQLSFDSIHYIVGITFQCIRFDYKNLQLSQKVDISKKIVPLLHVFLNKENHQNFKRENEFGSKDMIWLQEIICLIFEYSLSSRPTRWIKDNLFDIFQQIMLLDIPYLSKLQRLCSYLSQNYEFFGSALIILELSRIFQASKMISTQDVKKLCTLQSKLGQFIVTSFERYKQQMKRQSDFQKIATFNILKSLKQGKINNEQASFVCQDQNLKRVHNPKIRKYLLLNIVLEKIENAYTTKGSEQVLKLVEYVKTSTDLYNLDVLCCMNINSKLMLYTNNYAGLSAYNSFAASFVNCPQIYKRITKKYELKQIDCAMSSILSKIDRIQKRYPILCKINEQIDFQILQVIQQIIHYSIEINGSMVDHLMRIYKLYEQFNDIKLRSSELQVRFYYLRYFQVQIQHYFYMLGPDTRTVFTDNKEQYEKNYQYVQKLTVLKPKEIFLRFTVARYRYFQFLSNNQYKQSFHQLQILLQISEAINSNFLQLEILKDIISLSREMKKIKMISYSVKLLYNFCRSKQYFSFYLLSRSYTYTLITLLVFSKYFQPFFYDVILKLTQFLSKHPIQSYFNNLITLLDNFLKIYPQYGYTIHYSHFQKISAKSIKENPYLLIFYAYSLFNEPPIQQFKLLKIFAINCNSLSIFAQKKLLERYYSVYLKFLQNNNKKKLFYLFRVVSPYLSDSEKKKYLKAQLKNKNYIFLEYLQKKLINKRQYL